MSYNRLNDLVPQSAIDTDLYKLTMLQFIWNMRLDDINSTFRFIERNRETKPELEQIAPKTYKLAFDILTDWSVTNRAVYTDNDIEYLRSLQTEESTQLFHHEFLNYLQKDFKLAKLKFDKENLILYTDGTWAETTMWEIYVLSTINTLHNLARDPYAYERRIVDAEGNFKPKVELINNSGLTPKISDFGTRRRYSYDVHKRILELGKKSGIITSTSNLHLARELGMKPVGTFAHEIPMGMVGINDFILGNNEQFVYDYIYKSVFIAWKSLNKKGFNIALTDTYGSQKVFDYDLIDLNWDGVRHDSGCPYEFTNMVLRWISDKKKDGQILEAPFRIVYSDGLDFHRILDLERTFGDTPDIDLFYGIGTNLTNDVNLKPTSIVMKLTKIDGADTVKISDNLAKAVSYGDNPKQNLEKYKTAFGHIHNNTQIVTV